MTVLRVPSQYETINAAVADATAEDTILVACGVCKESVTVDVDRLRIEGESPACTILQGSNDGPGFFVTANLVTVSGFTVRDFGDGVFVEGSDNTIRNNRILNNAVGVFTLGQRNVVWDNSIDNAVAGIFLDQGDHNYVVGNRITVALFGIFSEQNNTLVAKNRISDCGEAILVAGNTFGSWINDNHVRNSGTAIFVGGGFGHHVYGNACTGNWRLS